MKLNSGLKAVLVLAVICVIVGAVAFFVNKKQRSTLKSLPLSKSVRQSNNPYPTQQQENAFVTKNTILNFSSITNAATTTYSQIPPSLRPFIEPGPFVQRLNGIQFANAASGYDVAYTYSLSPGPFSQPATLGQVYTKYRNFGNQSGWQLVNAKQMTGFEFFEFKNTSGNKLRVSYGQQNANTIAVDVEMSNS